MCGVMDVPLLLVSGILLGLSLLESAYAVTPAEVKHIGCYSSTFAESDSYYRVQQELSWEQGMVICIDRLTMYAGIQTVNGSSNKSIIYCGNDLLEHSLKVSGSECNSCVDKKNHVCGGKNTVSLYKIRDYTPLAVLMGTESKGVEMFINGSFATKVKVTFKNYVRVVDYSYLNDTIFFVYDTSIYRFSHGILSPTHNEPLLIKYMGAPSHVYGLALDWVNKRMYWSYTGYNHVYEANFEGTDQTQIHDYAVDPRLLKIDPYNRNLFILDYSSDTLLSYSLDAKEYSKHAHFGKFVINFITVFSNDVQNELVYAIGKIIDEYCSAKCLFKMDYKGEQTEVLYNGTELADPRGLDVFNGEAVWINKRSGSNTHDVYRCKLSKKCITDNLEKIYTLPQYIFDVKIYHPERQVPGVKHLCGSMACSHSCDKVSLLVVKCTCPAGMTLSLDNRTCEDDHFSVFASQPTEVLEEVVSTGKPTAKVMSNYEDVTQLNINLPKVPSDKKDLSSNVSQPNTVLIVLSISQMLMLVGFACIIAYMCVKQRRRENHVPVNRALELNENLYEKISEYKNKTNPN